METPPGEKGNGTDGESGGDRPKETKPGAETILVPGARDVRATLDRAGRAGGGGIVVTCPPHPQYGGTRADARLGAVSAALGNRGVSCLRFDYGDWEKGHGERLDTRNALRWAAKRYDRVGLFGYSFGATTALCVVGENKESVPEAPMALSVLAPDRGESGTDRDAPGALGTLECPLQICYGECDRTADWGPVVSRARECGFAVEAIPADHFFVGQLRNTAVLVASFLAEELR